jgi:hypothetical protein
VPAEGFSKGSFGRPGRPGCQRVGAANGWRQDLGNRLDRAVHRAEVGQVALHDFSAQLVQSLWRTKARTLCPLAISISAKLRPTEPTEPAAPVTRVGLAWALSGVM